jgi:hypothetical protein
VFSTLGTDGKDVGEGGVLGTLARAAVNHAAFGDAVMAGLKLG